jgi:2-methylcitrate dehydratase
METVAEKLGAYAASLRYQDIPAAVIHQTKRTLMDTIGCAFGGYDSEPAKMARELAALVSSTQPATLLCSGETTSAELATFANDVMIRYLDFNDGYIGKGGGHPSDSISALLATGEISNADGKDLIAATVVTYEVYARICDAWNNKASGHDHVTIGGIASVVGAARMLRLNAPQITEAVNIMIAGNIALNQTRMGNVSNWKACAYANASRNAVFAAQLAARGMTGPSPIFEGRNGFFKIVSGEPFELAPFGGDSRDYGIMKAHFKQFPLCNYAQTVVPAVLDARKLVTDINDITELHVHVSKKAMHTMADDAEKWRPRNRETADHSIPYTAAVALRHGTVELRHFDDEFLFDRDILALASRVKCSASDEATSREHEINLCDLDVTFRSGATKSIRVAYHRGHPRNPMTDEENEMKFRGFASAMLSKNQVDELANCLWKLDELPGIGRLIRLTVRQ